jgi:hypothetical protein
VAPKNDVFELGATPDRNDIAKTVRDLFERMHPGWTDEDLLNRPSLNSHFCAVVRETLGEDIEDPVIGGFLMNKRKRGGHAYNKPRQGVRLEVEMRAAGLTIERDDFCDTIADLFHGLYRNATTEEVLRRPKEGWKFCDAVRKKLKAPKLPEHMICQTLTNLRKSGALKRRQEAVA